LIAIQREKGHSTKKKMKKKDTSLMLFKTREDATFLLYFCSESQGDENSLVCILLYYTALPSKQGGFLQWFGGIVA
jgi:hypothetical protein